MPDPVIERPVPLGEIGPAALTAADPETPDLYTLAAFLLLCGLLHFPEYRERPVVEAEEILAMGFAGWNPELQDQDRFPLDPGELPGAARETLQGDYPLEDYYSRLYEAIRRAFETGALEASLQAVLIGLHAPHAIVRSCALRSALRLVRLPLEQALDLFGRLARQRFDRSDTAATIASISLASTFGMQPFGFSGTPTDGFPGPAVAAHNPILPIHGTVLPGSRPQWSVPGAGALYGYLKNNRPGTVGADRYFRWEGGYSEYAREVAGDNLAGWLVAHELHDSGAVCHSHGCNVLMLSTHRGARYDKVVLMSCPVHYHKYRPKPGSLNAVQSVRVNFDMVIAADGGAQRFPQNTIPDLVLPVWYSGHSITTEVDTWRNRNLLQFI